MDERAIEELLKRRYPEARFKVKLFPFGTDSNVLAIRTTLYNERGEEAGEEIREFLKRHGISGQFYRNIETGEIFAGEIAFVVVAPFDNEEEG
jgi:hypothetical protein